MGTLREEVNQFLVNKFGPEHYTNLNDALTGLCQKGLLSQDERDLLRKLSLKHDKHFFAAWETYLVMHDEDDFVQTLQVLCDVKRQNEQEKSEPVQAQTSKWQLKMFKPEVQEVVADNK